MIIGLAGKKGSGKTLAKDVILDHFSGACTYSFARPLKDFLGRVYRLTHEQLYGDQKEVVDPRYGKSPRQIMQEVGTDVLRAYDPDIWVRPLEYLASQQKLIVLDDVRFKNEAAAIHRMGGRVLYIARADAEGDAHISENDLGVGDADGVILNHGTKDKFKEVVIATCHVYI